MARGRPATERADADDAIFPASQMYVHGSRNMRVHCSCQDVTVIRWRANRNYIVFTETTVCVASPSSPYVT